jgi:hypothetical protein
MKLFNTQIYDHLDQLGVAFFIYQDSKEFCFFVNLETSKIARVK